MYDIVKGFGDVLIRAASRVTALRVEAERVFMALRANDDLYSGPVLVHHHFFVYGLFGHRQSTSDRWFLSKPVTQEEGLCLPTIWRDKHDIDDLLPRLWGILPVYLMVVTGAWNDACVMRLNEILIRDDLAVDGFSLMLLAVTMSLTKRL